MAVGVEAKNHAGARWFFEAQPLRADGHAAIGADLDESAPTPDIVPPKAAWRGPQHRTVFFPGLIPGPLRRLPQFPVDFLRSAMVPEGVDMRFGHFDFGDLFAGEVGGQSPLPELMFPFDFALGLRRGGIAQADVVELERPAQLGQGVGIVGEKDAVVIHVELERASVRPESGG